MLRLWAVYVWSQGVSVKKYYCLSKITQDLLGLFAHAQ